MGLVMAAVRLLPNLVVVLLMSLCLGGCAEVPLLKRQPQPFYPADEPPAGPPTTASLPTAPVYAAASMPAAPVTDSRLADLASQVEALTARLQAVEGKQAELEYQLNRLQQGTTPGQIQLQERVGSLEREVAALQEQVMAAGGRPAAAAPAPTPPPPAPVPPSPPKPPAKSSGDLFQEGLTLYRQKSYDAARDKWHRYLESHPKGEKAAEAKFYLGESYFQQRRWDEAIVAYNEVIEGYPRSPLAPAALLKQAQAFKAQGKTKVHRLILEKLVADYPKSPEAAQARRELAAAATTSPGKGR